MYSQKKNLTDREVLADISASVANNSDSSSTNSSSRIDVLSSSITTPTAPTITSSTIKDIDDPFVGLSIIEPLTGSQKEVRNVPTDEEFSRFSTLGSRSISSDQILELSEQSIESSSFSRIRQRDDNFSFRNKRLRTDALSCGDATQAIYTVPSTSLKDNDIPPIGLNYIEPPLEHEHQARFFPPVVPFSNSQEDSHMFDNSRFLTNQIPDSSNQSSESSVVLRSSRFGKSCDKILRNKKCSSKDGVISNINSTTPSTVFKNTASSCPTLRSILLNNQPKKIYDLAKTSVSSISKEGNLSNNYGFYSSHQSSDSFGLIPQSTSNSESSKVFGSDSSTNDKCSNIDGVISNVIYDSSYTVFKNSELPCPELRSIVLNYELKKIYDSIETSSSRFPIDDNRWVDYDSYRQSPDNLDSFGLSPQSTKNSESSKIFGCDNSINYKYSTTDVSACGTATYTTPSITYTTLKNTDDSFIGLNYTEPPLENQQQCSNAGILTRDVTTGTTSTLTFTTLNDIKEPFKDFSLIESTLTEHEHQARFVTPTISFPNLTKQKDCQKTEDLSDEPLILFDSNSSKIDNLIKDLQNR